MGVITARVVAGAAHGAPSPTPALYSNVCVQPETLDLMGIELLLAGSAAAPHVRIKVCEGGCWPEPVTEVRVDKSTLTISAIQELVDQDGHAVPSQRHRYLVRKDHARLIVTRLGGSELGRDVLWRQRITSPDLMAQDVDPKAVQRCR